MQQIPIVFHIGPLQVHTYGIGLAITFWFAYRYFAKRLRDHGYPDRWLGPAFVWIIVAAIIGARLVSVVADWSLYDHHLVDVFAVWHGGLSSFGGLAGGVPVGLYCARRRCPQLRLTVALDLVAPVLVIAWAVGRLLGPQLMYQGGGRRTSAWYGMYYHGLVGRRVPVPIWQAIECTIIFFVVLAVERWIARRGGPVGVVITVAVALYGLSRFFDEYLFLSHGTGGDHAVEGASIAFVAAGLVFAALLVHRGRDNLVPEPALTSLPERGGPSDPWAAPQQPVGESDEDHPEDAAEAGSTASSDTPATAVTPGGDAP